MVRLADIATVRRGYADPPQPMFRVNGQKAIGLGIAMRDGGDILALGANIKAAMATITADLPLGIEPQLVADQSVTVDHAIDDFMTSLWQSVAIILVVSFISLGVRAGLVVALSIPLTLAIVFAVMNIVAIDMQRVSLGALIIALGAARRRRHDDDGRDDDAPRGRREEGEGGDLRLQALRHGHAGRHARDHRRLRADRLRGEFGGRVHLLALRRRQHRARGVVARRGGVLAGARRRDAVDAEGQPARPSPAPSPSASGGC